MLEKLLALKQDKKWLFYLLIIPIGVLFIYEMYSKYLVGNSKSIVEDTQKKDDELKTKQIRAEEASKVHEEEAKKIEKQIDNTKVDKDWYLK